MKFQIDFRAGPADGALHIGEEPGKREVRTDQELRELIGPVILGCGDEDDGLKFLAEVPVFCILDKTNDLVHVPGASHIFINLEPSADGIGSIQELSHK